MYCTCIELVYKTCSNEQLHHNTNYVNILSSHRNFPGSQEKCTANFAFNKIVKLNVKKFEMNRSTIIFALIVLGFSIIQSSEAKKQICRCYSEGTWITSYSKMVTEMCGRERGLYCYIYNQNPYCEVANANDGFMKCCKSHGDGKIQGNTCLQIDD